MLAGYVRWYVRYCVCVFYTALDLDAWRFERSVYLQLLAATLVASAAHLTVA
jgi:hypothetical protein